MVCTHMNYLPLPSWQIHSTDIFALANHSSFDNVAENKQSVLHIGCKLVIPHSSEEIKPKLILV